MMRRAGLQWPASYNLAFQGELLDYYPGGSAEDLAWEG